MKASWQEATTHEFVMECVKVSNGKLSNSYSISSSDAILRE